MGAAKKLTRAAWLAERLKGIGASEAAAVLGVHPYRSALDVYAEKRGVAPAVDDEGNDAMEAGNRLEPVLARWYADRTGLKVIDPGARAIAWIDGSPNGRPIFATPDRYIEDPRDLKRGRGVLELKTVNAYARDEWFDGEPPVWTQVQLQHQMLVTRCTWGASCVLIGGQGFRWSTPIAASPEFQKTLVERELAFWRMVRDGIEPAPDHVNDARAATPAPAGQRRGRPAPRGPRRGRRRAGGAARAREGDQGGDRAEGEQDQSGDGRGRGRRAAGRRLVRLGDEPAQGVRRQADEHADTETPRTFVGQVRRQPMAAKKQRRGRTRAARLAAVFRRPAPERDVPLREHGSIVPFAERIARLRGLLSGRVGDLILRALPSYLDPQAFTDGAIAEVQRHPGLLDCDPGSLVGAIVEAAEIGLAFGAKQHAHLVSHESDDGRRKRASLIVGYRGMIFLAHQSEVVAAVHAQIVRKRDVFEVELGSTPKIVHRPYWKEAAEGDGSDVVAAYCVVAFKNGAQQFELLNRSQLDGVRARVEGSGEEAVWTTDFPAMARKTVVRSAMRLVPLGERAAKALGREPVAGVLDDEKTPAPRRVDRDDATVALAMATPPGLEAPRTSAQIERLTEALTRGERADARVARSSARAGRRRRKTKRAKARR